ncbi:hypothetical protein [Leptospira sp. GIMC2001]|uniref:hypothetical protein n=1 Tax=Leptospira sp. GIMC2001 TaxID=1513297 RepID=UPI0023499F88|nr:hypothetical protein [Leptospira sp. GIMC2001]WCL50974.1 hypothetical protein O4O04_09225 [Leptospira sp. GIMC2001]
MKSKHINTISNLFNYKLILDYEEKTYPMEILYTLENSIILKSFDKFQKLWSDRISGILIHAKDKICIPVSGTINGCKPAYPIESVSNLDSNEWLLEVQVPNDSEIPPEWIAFSIARN